MRVDTSPHDPNAKTKKSWSTLLDTWEEEATPSCTGKAFPSSQPQAMLTDRLEALETVSYVHP